MLPSQASRRTRIVGASIVGSVALTCIIAGSRHRASIVTMSSLEKQTLDNNIPVYVGGPSNKPAVIVLQGTCSWHSAGHPMRSEVLSMQHSCWNLH